MNPIRPILICLLAVTLWLPVHGNAEDIDIYSGLSGTGFTPNVLFVMDNSANFEADADYSCVIDGAATDLSGKAGGIEQCALYYVVDKLPVNPDGTARVNVGMMVYNDNDIRDVNNQNCGGSTGGCLAYPLTPMTAASKTVFQNWIKSWKISGGAVVGQIKAAGKANAAAMQEAWAYYAGNKGLSGRSYSGAIQPEHGCQKNFVIFIGNSYSNSGKPGDASSGGPGTALNDLVEPDPPLIANTVSTYCGPHTFTSPDNNHQNNGFYADEWARFMNQFDLYGGVNDPEETQSILTYTIGLLKDPQSCQAEYAALLKNMADYGGGKYFATTDYTSIVNALLQILNEIQAVNSVFASSSLPVSVNAQGTYLNQIYMGMFRPEASAKPRWVGNLKQYSFYLDTDGKLQLGDSIGRPALNTATGFVTPNAISYWTCSNSGNPYLTGATDGVANVNPTELTRLQNQKQICTKDPASGFWANAEEMANSTGKAFDLADGELVEKGGAAQQLRLANLKNDYTTAAGSATNPRKLFTFCPGGDAANPGLCKSDLTHSDNAFATGNAAFQPPKKPFGGGSSVNIMELKREGGTVTVTTASNHGFESGNSITIANATPGEYNGSKSITKISDTQFTYPITENPPLMATTTPSGTYQVSLATTSMLVSSLARTAGSTTITASATGHGFSTGDTVFINGSSEPQYNGPFTITVPSGPTGADTFTYSIPNIQETPPLAAKPNTGTAKRTKDGATFAIASVTRPLGSAIVTVTTKTPHGMTDNGGRMDLSGIESVSGISTTYNKTNRPFSLTGNLSTFTFTLSASEQGLIGPGTTNNSGITATKATTPISIAILTRIGTTASVTTSVAHNFDGIVPSPSVVISGTPGANESAYLGTYTISNASGMTFNYTLTTAPATPATGLYGATMTASQGEGVPPNSTELINWVRGENNNNDEHGPGIAVATVRPSIHGDVLHSRPTVVNYGGKTLFIKEKPSDSGGTRTATVTEADADKIGPVGATAEIRFFNGQICLVKRISATAFEYPSSNCGKDEIQTVATTLSNTVVYYGDNSGVFHAVNGNQANPPGTVGWPEPGEELWGFIPEEMFGKLNRLRTNSPQLELSTTPGGIFPAPKPKEYFVDGPVGVYLNINTLGTVSTSQSEPGAIIYLTMRRGGRVIYALNVTDPLTPKLLWKADKDYLWKVDNSGIVSVPPSGSGLGELGQTWSQPKVARVAGAPGEWVVIFGAGYDANEDEDPPSVADTMGRGIFVLKRDTGELIWRATHATSDPCPAGATCVTVPGMDYSIPADITLMDRDLDIHGYIDRMYAADTGGNIWRVDLEPAAGSITPNYWSVYKLAALGCKEGPCNIPPGGKAQRKFFYPPEVITTNQGYDAVIAGTGDREHPLYVDSDDTRTNLVVLVKDKFPGKNASGMKAITADQLGNLAENKCNDDDGFKYVLEKGEKVVNAPLVTAGSVYFGTNKPVDPASNSCTSTLGVARGYKLAPFSQSCEVPTFVEFAGGGLPPSPVSGVVNVENADGTITQVPFLIGGGDQGCVGAACGGSALEGQKPTINVPTTRTRTYWYREGK